MVDDSNIVLIGMPAVGKSTVGVLLAKRTGFAFLDTDIHIQIREGRSLQQIIQEEGLDRFKTIEEHHICSLNRTSHVIATGGSVVYSPAAMAHLKSSGIIVFLDLSLAPLKSRLKDIDGRGVLRMPGQSIDMLYQERIPLYRRHQNVTIACDRLTPDQVVKKILECPLSI